MNRAGRHVTAWTLALTVSAGVVAARVTSEPEAAAATTAKKCRTKKEKRTKRCRKHKPAAPKIESIEGDSFATRYGPVQVKLRMQGRKIVDVAAIVYPNDIERTKQISADCLPKLRQQVLSAQSAKIDGVAGATYTSDGYEKSVQSALDLA